MSLFFMQKDRTLQPQAADSAGGSVQEYAIAEKNRSTGIAAC